MKKRAAEKYAPKPLQRFAACVFAACFLAGCILTAASPARAFVVEAPPMFSMTVDQFVRSFSKALGEGDAPLTVTGGDVTNKGEFVLHDYSIERNLRLVILTPGGQKRPLSISVVCIGQDTANAIRAANALFFLLSPESATEKNAKALMRELNVTGAKQGDRLKTAVRGKTEYNFQITKPNHVWTFGATPM